MRSPFYFLLILLGSLLALNAQLPMPLVAQNCNNAALLVSEALDPDASEYAPGATVRVTWTLRNSGDCTWDDSYRLVFGTGDRMQGRRSLRLSSEVEAGDTLELEVSLTTPSEPDSYSGTWQLRAPDGSKFGPELGVTLEVGTATVGKNSGEAVTEKEPEQASETVILPEVLIFGGMGEAGDEDALFFCLDETGTLPQTPTVIVDNWMDTSRNVSLYICGLPEGTESVVEITSPEEVTFRRVYTEDAPVALFTEDGSQLTGTVIAVHLGWLEQSPTGVWQLNVSAEGLDFASTITVTPYVLPEFFIGEPRLSNWPVAPIDPFAVATACNYRYTPGQEMTVFGENLPRSTTLQLGLYQERINAPYRVDQLTVNTDAQGTFTLPYNAPSTGDYSLHVVQEIDPAGYSSDGVQFDMFLSEIAFSCLTVQPEVAPDPPTRLAFSSVKGQGSNIHVADLDNLVNYEIPFGNESCMASEPAWWPGGEWLVYQTNCVESQTEDITVHVDGGNYDLYAHLIDPTFSLPPEETLVQLTTTPDFDETEAHVGPHGWLVYRRAPAGTPLDESGELWIRDGSADVASVVPTPLGLIGRTPRWSPDGTQIVYMSDVEGSWQLYLFDIEENLYWPITPDCSTHCQYPAWSPDGKQIIYQIAAAPDDLTPAALWILNVASGTTRLWQEGAYARPAWSARGWISFESDTIIYTARQVRNAVPQLYLYSDPKLARYTTTTWSP